ncbi:predicted protein [Sclerotinia sclerotiorum 1980 UF-70]|uniref:Uncharacterized protein n=1 Tax=Sclerotinia sclerotiorum (strain ATCC 18683 / 1980 / Ss-1) TaxID=665079 RepID=A7ENY0_SCLS1|nr:predicted protein [Sclerotinia sclerotiorum 1980 UF-70]EDO04546.1 predicted protein [Sclerotinia sclerotiorum 1980 UF-70]
MSLSNKRKAGAPSIERSAKVPRTALGMEDSNSQISMAALFRANKLVHDLKESQLRTILVQAYVSHPEIAHVVDLEHAKINETLSEPDAEPDPAPDSASDSEPDHVAGDHAREGSDNDMSASEDEMTKRNRKITEVRRQLFL